MKCNNCNHENHEEAAFCENCGNTLSITKNEEIKTGEFCSSCGEALPENAQFCMECGAQQEMLCPKCESANPIGALFCQSCATPLPVICHKCKHLNKAGSIFCENCGEKTDQRPDKILRIVKHPAFIAAASIVLLFALSFLFTANRVNHYIELAEKEYMNQNIVSVLNNIKDAETYAFTSSQKEKIENTHFDFIVKQTDQAISSTKSTEYNSAAKLLKKADHLCTTTQHNDFVNQKYKNCLELVIDKGNGYTSDNKFSKAKELYATAEKFTKTGTQKDLLADNVSDYESKKNSYYRKQRQRQRQYSSGSSYSSRSVSQATVYFIWTKGSCWSREYKVSVSDPSYSSSISNGSDYAIIGNRNGIAGKYNFSLIVDCGGTYSSSGSFYINGKKSTYTVMINPYGSITVE
jgi:ribosomal protein L40E